MGKTATKSTEDLKEHKCLANRELQYMATERDHCSKDVPSLLMLQNNVCPSQLTFKSHTSTTPKKMQKRAHNLSGKFTFIDVHGLLNLWTLG